MPGGPGMQGPGPMKNDKPVEKDTDVKTPEPPKAAPPAQAAKKAPPPPVESKPDVAAALAPPAPSEPKSFAAAAASSQQRAKIIPAVPTAAAKTTKAEPSAAATNQTPAELAAAAVAAAMARLPGVAAKPPQVPQSQRAAGDNLSQRINDMRIDDQTRLVGVPRGTGRGRGGRGRGGPRGVVIPNTDFDFESSNKKFNKEDLAKEVEPSVAESADYEEDFSGDVDDVVIPAPPVYDKKSSFFDNISSEIKDREDKRVTGREIRFEERKKNMETFGQGSIDGFRGGYRGRGRGGRGNPRGRGGFGMNRGRGGTRGFGGPQTLAQ
jgi:protein LSM14